MKNNTENKVNVPTGTSSKSPMQQDDDINYAQAAASSSPGSTQAYLAEKMGFKNQHFNNLLQAGVFGVAGGMTTSFACYGSMLTYMEKMVQSTGCIPFSVRLGICAAPAVGLLVGFNIFNSLTQQTTQTDDNQKTQLEENHSKSKFGL